MHGLQQRVNRTSVRLLLVPTKSRSPWSRPLFQASLSPCSNSGAEVQAQPDLLWPPARWDAPLCREIHVMCTVAHVQIPLVTPTSSQNI